MTTKNRKLTEEQKQEIVAMRSEDATLRKIASKFGVSPKTIMFVLNPDYYTAHKEKNREYFRLRAAAKKLNSSDSVEIATLDECVDVSSVVVDVSSVVVTEQVVES